MRLGSRVTIIKDPDSLAYKLYGGQPVVYERHRHRYEVLGGESCADAGSEYSG